MLLAIFKLSNLQAQTIAMWAKGAGGTSMDRATQVVNDHAGNTYISGYFTGVVDMDPGAGIYNLTSAGSYDVFVLKLDPIGNFLWARSLGGSVIDAPAGIAVDENQHVYIPILFNGTADLDPGVAVNNVTSLGNEDMAVINLDENGNLLWAKVIGANYAQYPTSIMIDHDSNILICGDFKGTVDFDPGPGISNLSATQVQYSVFVLKLTNTGNYIWAKSFGGPVGTEGFSASIAIDTMNNVYTTGIYLGTIDFNPGAGVYNLTGDILKDCFVTKLTENGDFSWALSFGSSSYDYARGIQVSSTNEIYVTGHFRTTCDFNPGAGVNNLTALGAEDAFILKLTDAGNYVWAKQLGGAGSATQSKAITIDNSGASYATGTFDGTVDFDPNAGTGNLSAISGASNVFISKLDINGNYVWAKTVGGSYFEIGQSISLHNNNVFVGGWNNSNPMLIDAFSLPNYGNSDIFVAKFSQCGIDVTPPTPNVASLPDIIEQCQVTSLSAPSATDNCGGPVIITGTHNVPLPITTQGTTVVTWTYADGNGNITTQNQNIMIDDQTNPIANIVTLPDITSECSVTSLTAPTAMDNCAGTISGTHNVTLPITTQGTTVVTWTYADGNGNITTQNQNIIIDDQTNPIANIVTLPDITSECSVTSLTAPTATDNCAGTITGTHNATLPITSQGTTVVTWTYNDGNGNTITQNQNVIIDDSTGPIANVVTLADITSQCSVASLTAPTATDNCAGTITGTHNVTLPITTQGTTVVTWTYDDGNGNTTTQNQNVIIDDNTGPIANVVTLADITGQCSVASLTAPTATDNCAGTITGTHNATLPITTQGTTVVTWTYDDGNGNTTTQNQNVIIDDNTGPIADVISLSEIISECSITSLTAPTATDNCAGTISGTHNATLPITTQGTTVVTWTYDDGNGNINTQNQHVIINQIDNSVSFNITTLTATATGYTYQWIDCGNGNTPIAGETNQSYTATVNGSYAVEISNGSCSVTSDCTDITITFGVNENNNQNGISVFPNPNNGIFNILFQSEQNKTIEIELLDISGKLIESRIFSSDNKIQLAYGNLKDGVYLLFIKTGNNNTMHKIIIQQ
jgi:hypothetical protein